MRPIRFLLAYAAVLLLGSGAIMGFNWYRDPVQLYSARKGTRVTAPPRFREFKVARRNSAPALLVGNSHAQNFRPAHFSTAGGTRVDKVAIGGLTLGEAQLVVEAALEAHPLKAVYWAVGEEMLPTRPGRTRAAAAVVHRELPAHFPKWLWQPQWHTPLSYLLSLDTLSWSFQAAAGLGIPSLEAHVVWSGRFKYGLGRLKDHAQRFRRDHPNAVRRGRPLLGAVDGTSVAEAVAQTLGAAAQRHPEVTFHVFTNPKSALGRAMELYTEAHSRALALHNGLASTAAAHPNIVLHDFATELAWTAVPANYKDLWHFHGRINRRMAAAMVKGTHRRTPDEMRAAGDRLTLQAVTAARLVCAAPGSNGLRRFCLEN